MRYSLIVLLLLILSSCAQDVYHPNSYYVPNHTKANEWAVQSNLRFLGGDFQSSYSFTNHLAAYGGLMLKRITQGGDSAHPNVTTTYRYMMGEVGIMYFDSFTSHLKMEGMLGYGGGSLFNNDGQKIFNRFTSFNRFFAQGDISYVNKFIQIGAVAKFTNFSLYNSYGSSFVDFDRVEYNKNSLYIEPGYFIKLGYDPVYLFSQGGLAYKLDKNNVKQVPFFNVVGVSYRIGIPKSKLNSGDELLTDKMTKEKKPKKVRKVKKKKKSSKKKANG
ncbi:MAG: hypothetical protein NTX03_08855 [Bacteroidetes bacterium]|nr:hypothetical protein [Bacteroidota bacterium]